MRTVTRIAQLSALVLFVVGCATQDPAPAVEIVEEDDVLDVAIWFAAADGTRFESGTQVTLPTGGPASGRLVPKSADPDVTLFVTRDGSVPTPENNWGGPIDPRDPFVITRSLEGPATYRLVAVSDGVIGEPVQLAVNWRHEESPRLSTPAFTVGGRTVSGSIDIPVSDGSDVGTRLAISCDYSIATLYITRDGSAPSEQNYWRSQICDGTFIWSPEPTAAEYRVTAVWQGARSPVAALNVEWVSR